MADPGRRVHPQRDMSSPGTYIEAQNLIGRCAEIDIDGSPFASYHLRQARSLAQFRELPAPNNALKLLEYRARCSRL